MHKYKISPLQSGRWKLDCMECKFVDTFSTNIGALLAGKKHQENTDGGGDDSKVQNVPDLS